MRFLPSFLLPAGRDDSSSSYSSEYEDDEPEIIYGPRTGGRKLAAPYLQRSSHANLRDYLPYNQQRLRSSWCDKTFPEFQATIKEKDARNNLTSHREFIQARVDEMNAARMELGLEPWRFHPRFAEENLVYWYGTREDAPLRFGRNDREEKAAARARTERTRVMKKEEDEEDAGSLVGLLRGILKGKDASKPSVFQEMMVNLKLLFSVEKGKSWIKHKSMVR
ncbi:hypothetical protein VKT23_009652 [Stygiomarasmius scandens]|uniref:Uncharacterized protein n=1 Tax=Marasmiellus scandens TaxID=2682957 RepID=A0ABR1JGR0_9AGAR